MNFYEENLHNKLMKIHMLKEYIFAEPYIVFKLAHVFFIVFGTCDCDVEKIRMHEKI